MRVRVTQRHTGAAHGWCTTTAPWRAAAPHLAMEGVLRHPEEAFRMSSRHQQARHRPARPFDAMTYFLCKSLSGRRHQGRSQGGGRRRTWAGAEVPRLSVCTRASSRVRIARRSRTYRCHCLRDEHRHVCMITMLKMAWRLGEYSVAVETPSTLACRPRIQARNEQTVSIEESALMQKSRHNVESPMQSCIVWHT